MYTFNHKRGIICVLRLSNGRLEALAISEQTRYNEFNGCFSLL